MVLEKVDPRSVVFNERLQAYRAFPQDFVEADIFRSTFNVRYPSYRARTGNGGTFVTTNFLGGLGYARDWAALMDSKRVPSPFTQYITLVGINMWPYLNRLYRDTSGNEGLVVLGPIALEDIDVFFSADKDALNAEDLETFLLPDYRSQEDLRDFFQRRKCDMLQMAGERPASSLVSKYCESPEALIEDIHHYLKQSSLRSTASMTREEVAWLLPMVISLFEAKDK